MSDLQTAREALALAANRLHRCSVDVAPGTREFYERRDWVAEAREVLVQLDAELRPAAPPAGDVGGLVERLSGPAIEAALRLIAGSFRRDGERLDSEHRPRFTIPARPENDDTFVIDSLKQAASTLTRLSADNAALVGALREWHEARRDTLGETPADVRVNSDFRVKLNRLSNAEAALATLARATNSEPTA